MFMKQRVIDAICHKQTDLTPWHIDLTMSFTNRLKQELGIENAESFLGNHLTRAKYKQNEILGDRTERDIFGVSWQKVDDGGDVGVVIGFPLKEKNIDGYIFPEIRVDFAKKICRNLEQDTSGRFRMFSLTMCYFERAWSLRGMENLLMDMYLDEKGTEALFAKILEHHLKLFDIVLDYDYEGVYFGDDWGQQRGLIMGPKYWRKYIKPGFVKMFEKVKSKGKYIILHSCGDNRTILPDLIDMGMDVYNTIQPEIYDLQMIKKEYGKDLTFYGGISTQQFLPKATIKDCEEMALYMLDVLGKDGGFIFAPSHAATPDIPSENILSMLDVVKNYVWI